MRTRTKRMIALVGLGVAAGLAVGTGAAVAGGGDDEATVSGRAADRAVAAALRVTGGGQANSVERDTEDGATWEVEVTRPNGDTVDVRLDENLDLVVFEGDSEGNESESG